MFLADHNRSSLVDAWPRNVFVSLIIFFDLEDPYSSQ